MSKWIFQEIYRNSTLLTPFKISAWQKRRSRRIRVDDRNGRGCVHGPWIIMHWKYAQSQICSSYNLLNDLLNCDWAYFLGCVDLVAIWPNGRSSTPAMGTDRGRQCYPKNGHFGPFLPVNRSLFHLCPFRSSTGFGRDRLFCHAEILFELRCLQPRCRQTFWAHHIVRAVTATLWLNFRFHEGFRRSVHFSFSLQNCTKWLKKNWTNSLVCSKIFYLLTLLQLCDFLFLVAEKFIMIQFWEIQWESEFSIRSTT